MWRAYDLEPVPESSGTISAEFLGGTSMNVDADYILSLFSGSD